MFTVGLMMLCAAMAARNPGTQTNKSLSKWLLFMFLMFRKSRKQKLQKGKHRPRETTLNTKVPILFVTPSCQLPFTISLWGNPIMGHSNTVLCQMTLVMTPGRPQGSSPQLVLFVWLSRHSCRISTIIGYSVL